MYLTDKKLGLSRKMQDHEDLEVLLESFDKQVEEIVNESETTIVSPVRTTAIRVLRFIICVRAVESNVQSTQEIVELILDSNRNALLTLDLKVSIGTFGIGVGALVAGLFGMNVSVCWVATLLVTTVNSDSIAFSFLHVVYILSRSGKPTYP